jgi:hypothetical protein
MKFVISESNLGDLESKSDMIFHMLNILYPNYETYYNEKYDDTEIIHGYDTLLVYLNRNGNLIVNIKFIEKLFDWSNLPFLDYVEIKRNKRKMFDELMTVFAKKHFGWDVNLIELTYL